LRFSKQQTDGLGGENMKVSLVLLLGSLVMAQSAGTFTPTGNMSAGRIGHTATLLNDGRVLIAGGYAVCCSGLASAELYDPSTGIFTATGNMAAPRYNHTATLLPNGLVMIAGGTSGSSVTLDSAELYDPTTGTFSPTGALTIPREWHAATLLSNGKVLITGGAGGHDLSRNVWATTELYDPSTRSFALAGRMTAARACHKAVLLANGEVLITVGSGCDSPAASAAELYDPGTGTSMETGGAAALTALGDSFVAATAKLLTNGKVLVSLAPSHCDELVPNTQLYDLTTETFSLTGSMQKARCLEAGVLLSDGKVLIAGTWSCTDSITAELYDPASGAFIRTGDMTAGRYLQTMTLLKDGRVLVVGGVGVATMPCRAWAPPTAELYNPPSVAPPPCCCISQPMGQDEVRFFTRVRIESSRPATLPLAARHWKSTAQA
jgi:hypothetical protein